MAAAGDSCSSVAASSRSPESKRAVLRQRRYRQRVGPAHSWQVAEQASRLGEGIERGLMRAHGLAGQGEFEPRAAAARILLHRVLQRWQRAVHVVLQPGDAAQELPAVDRFRPALGQVFGNGARGRQLAQVELHQRQVACGGSAGFEFEGQGEQGLGLAGTAQAPQQRSELRQRLDVRGLDRQRLPPGLLRVRQVAARRLHQPELERRFDISRPGLQCLREGLGGTGRVGVRLEGQAEVEPALRELRRQRDRAPIAHDGFRMVAALVRHDAQQVPRIGMPGIDFHDLEQALLRCHRSASAVLGPPCLVQRLDFCWIGHRC
jgi:hypothetical protein